METKNSQDTNEAAPSQRNASPGDVSQSQVDAGFGADDPLEQSSVKPSDNKTADHVSTSQPFVEVLGGGSVMVPQTRSPGSGVLVRRTRDDADQVVPGISPMARRMVVGAGRAGLSIANGILLSRNAVLNPVVSAALVAYECFQAVRDYRNGAMNTLGYQTSRTDLALRLGKSVGLAGIGMGIGQAVGALVGLSAIPVAGQIVLTAVLSVGVGICVGTLLTRHIDRLFARWQIRSQYGYPADEQGARSRFEQLLEERHDLSTLETCKIVQHYADYRVASGWESSNDIDDYRATGDIRHMPVSFQHFAMVQLQRKWGFLSDHSACKKVFKVLMLQHHPDRGGSTEMAALLNRDYEIYAFCQGWDEDCPNLLNAEGDPSGTAPGATSGRPKKRNVVVDFIRSLFRSATTTDAEANDLHQHGLLTLEAGTRTNLHRLDALDKLGEDDADNKSFASPTSLSDGTPSGAGAQARASGEAKQRSITRVLSALQQTYQMTSEAITFGGLARAAEDKETWARVREEVVIFNRMQCFVRVSQEHVLSPPRPPPLQCNDEVGDSEPEIQTERTVDPLPREHQCGDFRWRTVAEATDRRETARGVIIEAVFLPETSRLLETALNLWKSAQSLVQSYFKQCAAERQQERLHSTVVGDHDGTKQTLETLLSIQRKMQKLSQDVSDPWKGKEGEWAVGGLQGSSTLIEDMREVGLTASYALAGEHAKTLVVPRMEECDTYFGAWDRKRHTIKTVLGELRRTMAERDDWRHRCETNSAAAEHTSLALEEIQQRIDNYTTQLVLLQQQQAEVDAQVAELVEICTCHLPEALPILAPLPSTCARAIHKGRDAQRNQRRLLFERERTLMNYQRVELEPLNRMAPPADPAESFPHDLVHAHLFKAVHTDTLTGTTSYCWLKSYYFPERPTSSLEDIDTDDDDADMGPGRDRVMSAGTRGRHRTQDEVLQQILEAELLVASGCHSKYLLPPTDVFTDPEKRRVFFQIPRGATQQRFSSVYEIRKRIRPLGLRWLLDAMQCLIDLHSCQLAHGHVSLSNFTFDDFGNTALGLFDPARPLIPDPSKCNQREEEEETEKDVIDFGAMVLSEVLPYLFSGTADVHVGVTPPPQGATHASPLTPHPSSRLSEKEQHMAQLFREVGERLIGKENPRWSLLQARTFVRRCLQFNFETDESSFLFSKEIAYPPYWDSPRAHLPQLIVRDRRVTFHHAATSRGEPTVFLNVNIPLWEVFWTCRRKMANHRMGTYSTPPVFQKMEPLLTCSDDCETNERFLWFPCENEEEAWDICQRGFPRVPRALTSSGVDDTVARYKDTARFWFTMQGSENRRKRVDWGLVCRVAVGTVVSASTNPSFAGPPPNDAGRSAMTADKVAYAAQRRCHLETSDDEHGSAALLVPCPYLRCYPEYVVKWSLA